jgi:amino acid transporter
LHAQGLAHRSRHGTPTYGILLSSVGVMCLSTFSFVDIVELLNAIYCLAELLEFAAYVWLRVRAPNLPRPYK